MTSNAGQLSGLQIHASADIVLVDSAASDEAAKARRGCDEIEIRLFARGSAAIRGSSGSCSVHRPAERSVHPPGKLHFRTSRRSAAASTETSAGECFHRTRPAWPCPRLSLVRLRISREIRSPQASAAACEGFKKIRIVGSIPTSAAERYAPENGVARHDAQFFTQQIVIGAVRQIRSLAQGACCKFRAMGPQLNVDVRVDTDCLHVSATRLSDTMQIHFGVRHPGRSHACIYLACGEGSALRIRWTRS